MTLMALASLADEATTLKVDVGVSEVEKQPAKAKERA
jgi:hypothetical protein